MRLRSLAVAGFAVIALVAAGCGSSSSGGGSSGSTSSAGSMTTAASTSAATVKTASTPLGTILVDAQGRTLYQWKGDTSASSACTGTCATEWPPLTTHGRPVAGSGVQTAMLGTSKRADGTLQVTYAGHPLYRFLDDSAAGDTNGQGSNGFGALWWVTAPDGAAITKTAGSGGGSADSSGGGSYGGY
ncbi:COG4315 family predicted lipoprotein [Conexibacter woesei]|uniref:Lipoprotein n=1 Tax=Conexibacter woesei (strain DSM 14684 / CCUG 47730 / CIP 108061 / JCM 11494 / NBRC 100937 / ID131577) TaxID=469383 RepID=D3F763_CONWI|nr:hypothetical protein [Conexibacter woesei]ADB48834.1 Secreted repeat of unknown function [Conexibacter woesei DSM 14684]